MFYKRTYNVVDEDTHEVMAQVDMNADGSITIQIPKKAVPYFPGKISLRDIRRAWIRNWLCWAYAPPTKEN